MCQGRMLQKIDKEKRMEDLRRRTIIKNKNRNSKMIKKTKFNKMKRVATKSRVNNEFIKILRICNLT